MFWGFDELTKSDMWLKRLRKMSRKKQSKNKFSLPYFNLLSNLLSGCGKKNLFSSFIRSCGQFPARVDRHAGAQWVRWGGRETQTRYVWDQGDPICLWHCVAVWATQLDSVSGLKRSCGFPPRHKRQHIKGSSALSQRHHRVFFQCVSSLSLLRSVWNAAALTGVRAINKKRGSHQNTSAINNFTCKHSSCSHKAKRWFQEGGDGDSTLWNTVSSPSLQGNLRSALEAVGIQCGARWHWDVEARFFLHTPPLVTPSGYIFILFSRVKPDVNIIRLESCTSLKLNPTGAAIRDPNLNQDQIYYIFALFHPLLTVSSPGRCTLGIVYPLAAHYLHGCAGFDQWGRKRKIF